MLVSSRGGAKDEIVGVARSLPMGVVCVSGMSTNGRVVAALSFTGYTRPYVQHRSLSRPGCNGYNVCPRPINRSQGLDRGTPRSRAVSTKRAFRRRFT